MHTRREASGEAASSDEPAVACIPTMGGTAVEMDSIKPEVQTLSYFDYKLGTNGNLKKTQGRGLFRCAGDAHLAFGFQLTV